MGGEINIEPKAKVALFFDKNFNGKEDADEIKEYNSSSVFFDTDNKYVNITTSDRKTTKLENIDIWKGDNYYKTGTIPIAVIDGINVEHGRHVINILKNENPELSITGFDHASFKSANFLQRNFVKFVDHTALGRFLYTNELTGGLMRSLEEKLITPDLTLKNCADALDDVKKQMDKGIKFQAVNMSSGIDISYEQINAICEQELGEKITPENIAKHKTKIKEILNKKAKENSDLEITATKPAEEMNLGLLMDIVSKIEKLEVPVYVAQSYKEFKTGQQTFNIYSLANNSRTVEAGKINSDGTINSPGGSTNSMALDEKGQRRIAAPVHYTGEIVEYASTSYATPMVLARDFKK